MGEPSVRIAARMRSGRSESISTGMTQDGKVSSTGKRFVTGVRQTLGSVSSWMVSPRVAQSSCVIVAPGTIATPQMTVSMMIR